MSEAELLRLVQKWREAAKADRGYDSGAYFSGQAQGREGCADELERLVNESLGLKENNA